MQPPLRKKITRIAATAFGGDSSVNRYRDDSHGTRVDVLSCKDSPHAGVSSFATIGVSEATLMTAPQESGVRTELVGACDTRFKQFADCLSTAAFFVINNGWSVARGAIFPDVLSIYGLSPTMRHFILLRPFLWERKLRTIHLSDGRVTWLLAVPISNEERAIAEAEGAPVLEALLQRGQVNVFDLNRRSVTRDAGSPRRGIITEAGVDSINACAEAW